MVGQYSDTVTLILKFAARSARTSRSPLHDEHLVLAMFELTRDHGVEVSGLTPLRRSGITEETFRACLKRRPRPQPTRDDIARLLGADIDFLCERALQMALDVGSERVESEHLLLAILYEEDRAARTLVDLGLSYADVRELVLENSQEGKPDERGNVLPLSLAPSARKTRSAVYVAGLARQLATYDDVYQGQMGSHHYLLALMMDDESLATKALESFGLSYRSVANRVEELRQELELDADAPNAPNLPHKRFRKVPGGLNLSEGQREALRDMGKTERVEARNGGTSPLTRGWWRRLFYDH